MTSKTWTAIGRNTHPHRGGWMAAGGAAWRLICTIHRNGQERRQLNGLSDHQLRDIGLSRADIEIALDKPLWRD